MDRQQTFRRVSAGTILCAVAVLMVLCAAPAQGGGCTIIITPGPPSPFPPPPPFALPGGTESVFYSQTLTGSNCTSPYAFSVSAGSLPPGLTLTTASATTATISGTPTATGTFAFTIQATGPFGGFRTVDYTITITCPSIGILPSNLPGGTQSTPYNQTLTGVGGQSPYTFLVLSGTLPPGLSLSNSGVISGTPTTPGGPFSFTVQATDAAGCRGTANYTINIAPACVAPAAPFLTASPSTLNTFQPITLTWNATIASGLGSYDVLLSFNGGPFATIGTVASSSATSLSFTQVATTAGTYDFEIRATASCGSSSLSNIARVVVMAPCPQAPRVTGLVLTPTTAAPGASFTLSWNPLGAFSGSYLVYRSTDGGKNFSLLATTSNTSFTGTVTDTAGTLVTFEVEGLVNCIFPTQSNFVSLTVISGNCAPPGAVSNIQIQSAGVVPSRAPAPTEFIAVSWTPPSGGTPPTRYSVRINGDPEVLVQGTSVTLLPRGSRLDPIQAFVKALACIPETAGPEASSAVVALFLTSPKASFTVSSNPRVNVAVVFTDTSAPQATSWLWVFDDGTTDQRQSPSHVFIIPGPHVVNFIASNGAGSSNTAQTIQVSAAAGVIEAARLVELDTSDPVRRRATVSVGDGRTWLWIRALADSEAVVFLRFLDSTGEMVLERRLVVGGGQEGLYDLSAYGLRGNYGIELVSGGEYEGFVTVVGRPGVREMER